MAWLTEWFERNYSADILSADFHDQYSCRFPEYKKKINSWGSSPVPQAMRDLRLMASCGMLTVSIISIGSDWQPGFPRWVKTYQLNDN